MMRWPGGGSTGRRAARALLGLGLALIILGLCGLVFGNAILNRVVRARLERAFLRAYPGHVLHLGELHYDWTSGRLRAFPVSLHAPDWTVHIDRVSVQGGRWGRMLFRAPASVILGRARMEAASIEVVLPGSTYRLQCATLRAGAPEAEILAEGVELRPLLDDAAFFGVEPSRRTRFRVSLAECRATGVAFTELLRGSAFTAGNLALRDPVFDAMSDRYKPLPPFVESPLMAGEALARLPLPVRIDHLQVSGGRIVYGERSVAGTPAGELTFTAVELHGKGITNPSEGPMHVQVQGNLMDAGRLAVALSIPVQTERFAVAFHGTLAPMAIDRLNPFLEGAERIRIRSGTVQEVAFGIQVDDGVAHGQVKAHYRDLYLTVLDPRTGSATASPPSPPMP